MAAAPRVVRVPPGSPDLSGRRVVVVADDGPQWFRLRSLGVRGPATPLGERTYRVVPERVVAWDYGALRETSGSPGSPRAPRVPAPAGADPRPFRCGPLDAALESSRVMIVATRSPKGTAFAVPLWFVAHRGRLYAGTSAASWTVPNVAACPQVAVLLGGEGGGDSAERLVVAGSARAHLGAPPPEVLLRIAWRYYLHPEFAAVELRHRRLWPLRLRYYRQAQAAHVVVTPQSADEVFAPDRTGPGDAD